MDARVEPERRLSDEELMLLNCGVGEDSWASLELQGDQTSQSQRKSVLIIHWKDWCWSWNSILGPPDVKSRLIRKDWCWERLKAGGEGDDRGPEGRKTSLTQWRWVWASSSRWWRTGKSGMLQSMELQSQTWLSDWTTIKCNALESPRSHPSLPVPPVRGKIIFYETGPWCQKVWGPLFITFATMSTMSHTLF